MGENLVEVPLLAGLPFFTAEYETRALANFLAYSYYFYG